MLPQQESSRPRSRSQQGSWLEKVVWESGHVSGGSREREPCEVHTHTKVRKEKRPNYYELMGCKSVASENEIKSSYREQVWVCGWRCVV